MRRIGRAKILINRRRRSPQQHPEALELPKKELTDILPEGAINVGRISLPLNEYSI
jgi:hypothetical protein